MRSAYAYMFVSGMLIASLANGGETQVQDSQLEQRLNRLAAVLWREPPSCLELSVYEKTQQSHEPVDVLRARIEAERRDMAKADGVKTSDAEFKRGVDEALKAELEFHSKPLLEKREVVVKGRSFKYNVTTLVTGGEVDGPPHKTYGNTSDVHGGESCGYFIEHDRKLATIIKSQWHSLGYQGLGSFSPLGRASLQVFLGDLAKKADGSYGLTEEGNNYLLPNPEKISALAAGKGETETYKIEIIPERDAQGRNVHVLAVLINVKGEDEEMSLIRRFYLDAERYDICYREECYQIDGTLALLREASDLVDIGGGYYYPKSASITTYLPDGSMKMHREMAFDAVKVNTDIEESYFDFSAPADYTCIDHRYGEPIIAAPHGPGQALLDVPMDITADDVAMGEQEDEASDLGSDTENVTEGRGGDSEGGRTYVAVAVIMALLIAVGVIWISRKKA